MHFDSVVENVGKSIDGVGVGITALGTVLALGAYVADLLRRRTSEESYRAARRRVGRAILLGLELLVAGDIIRSVVVSPSFQSVGVLAIIVAVRSFLSATLEIEITGRPPWRGEATAGTQPGARPRAESRASAMSTGEPQRGDEHS